MGYTKEAIKGVSWLSAFRLVARGLSFIRTLVIARILSPYQFGVYGIAGLVLALIEILTETGINVFLIQKKDDIGRYINTAWIVSIIRGALISMIILVSSKAVSIFFKNPDVVPLLLIISTVPLIRGFINPSIVRFQKELNFNKEFSYRSSIFLIETAISIVLLFILKNPIALIYGLVGGAIFEVFISFQFASPKPVLKFQKDIFKEIIVRGRWITSGGILGYLFENADNMVVGRILGASSLGIYDMAYSISMLPISEVSDIVARVTFPVYVKISSDLERLKKAYIKTSVITLVLVVPILLLLLLFPKELILIVLGAKWIAAENVIRIIAIFALVSSLSSPTGAVFFALERQKYQTLLTGIGLFVMLASIVPLVNSYGIVGAGVAATIGSAITLPFRIYFLAKVFTRT